MFKVPNFLEVTFSIIFKDRPYETNPAFPLWKERGSF